MMLINKLYRVSNMDHSVTQLRAAIVLNEQHAIFMGHFPNVPVLPGVTMMHIIKELIEEGEQQKLMLESATNMKFLQMINPSKNKHIQVEVNIKDHGGDLIKVSGSILSDDTVCFKMNAQFLKL